MTRTLQELFFDPNDEPVVLFEDLCSRLEAKARETGLHTLSEPARTILLADRYDAGMFRSGWYSLMRWDDYDIMAMIPALEGIGAAITAKVLKEVASLFPSGTIPTNVSQRVREYNDQVMVRFEPLLESLNEQLHSVFESECVYHLTYRFALAHREQLSNEDA